VDRIKDKTLLRVGNISDGASYLETGKLMEEKSCVSSEISGMVILFLACGENRI
jgi:hypothetical protein